MFLAMFCTLRPYVSSVGLVIALVAGCSKPSGTSDGGGAVVSSTESLATGQSAPTEASGVSYVNEVSEADAEAFADRLKTTVIERRHSDFNRLVDYQKILDRAWQGIPISDQSRAAFDKGFMSSFDQQSPLAMEISQMVASGGSYDLLRVRQRDGHRTVLFRALLASGGVNYHEFRLRKASDGSVYADDVFILMSAEWFSETMSRLCMTVAAEADKTWLDKLVGKQQLFIKHISQVNAMTQALQRNDRSEVIRIFGTLPADLREDKNLLMVRFRAASESGDDKAYLDAMRDMRRHHPDDACCALMLIDYDLMTKKYELVFAGIDKLDAEIGSDPYMDVLRAGVYLDQGKLDEAVKVGRRVIEADPTLQSGYWTLINIENARKNHDQVVRWIEELSVHLPLTPEDFAADPNFVDFVHSPEFVAWVERTSKP